jgi:hypothetical protein
MGFEGREITMELWFRVDVRGVEKDWGVRWVFAFLQGFDLIRYN